MKYSGTKADVIALITIELGGMFVESDLTLEKESDTCMAEECPPVSERIDFSWMLILISMCFFTVCIFLFLLARSSCQRGEN